MAFEVVVGPIASAEFAAELERAGGTMLAVVPNDLPRFGMNAVVSVATADVIRSRLERAKLGLILDGQSDVESLEQLVSEVRPDWVAVNAHRCCAADVLPLLGSARPDLLLLGAALDYDEDPAWTEGLMQRWMDEWNPKAIVLTLGRGLNDPVRWLRGDDRGGPDEANSSDVRRLCERFPILINIDISEDDIAWLLEEFPAARGIAFLAGDRTRDGGSPTLTTFESLHRLVARAAGYGVG